MIEVFRLRLLAHPVGKGPQDSLHHGQMFPVLMGLEQGDSLVQLVQNTAYGPDVAGLTPSQL